MFWLKYFTWFNISWCRKLRQTVLLLSLHFWEGQIMCRSKIYWNLTFYCRDIWPLKYAKMCKRQKNVLMKLVWTFSEFLSSENSSVLKNRAFRNGPGTKTFPPHMIISFVELTLTRRRRTEMFYYIEPTLGSCYRKTTDPTNPDWKESETAPVFNGLLGKGRCSSAIWPLSAIVSYTTPLPPWRNAQLWRNCKIIM